MYDNSKTTLAKANRSTINYAYIFIGVLLAILTYYTSQHTSISKTFLNFSSRYTVLLITLFVLSLLSLSAGFLLNKSHLINTTTMLITGMICLGIIESTLIYKPTWLINNKSLISHMDPRSSLYLRALKLTNQHAVQLHNERLVFDGLYYNFKPGIRFNEKVDTLDGPKESMINIDEIGFRNEYGTFTNNQHIPYIFLGDSGTFGSGYAQPFPDVFGKLSGGETLNLSIGGHGPQMYLNSLKEFGIHKNPKYIFLTLFLNDMENAYSYDLLQQHGRGHQDYFLLYTSSLSFSWPNNIAAQLILEHCNTCMYLDAITSLGISTNKAQISNTNNQKYSLLLDYGKTHFPLPDTPQPPQKMCPYPCRESTISTLRQITTLAASKNSKIILTYLPHPTEIYYTYIKQNRALFYETHDPDNDNFGWNKELNQISNELGIEFADPRPFLITAAAQTPFLYRNINDAHLSAHGHDVFARFLYKYVDNPK